MSFVSRNHPQQTKVRGALDLVDDRATAPEVFGPLNQRFGFSIDVAASTENTKLPRYYDRFDDGLAQTWAGESVWCNPPYSDIRSWIEKAHSEWDWSSPRRKGAELIVMLLPANRTEQGWWQDLIEPYRLTSQIRVEFLRGRMRFIKPGADSIGPNERPPFGVCLVIWGSRSCEPSTPDGQERNDKHRIPTRRAHRPTAAKS
jgi:phage N-6-adenine-methyltransferase